MHFCKNCGRRIKNSCKSFCNSSCLKEHNRKPKVQRVFLTGILKGAGKRIVREELIRETGGKCSKCGWNEVNLFSNEVPLEVNHVDGNKHNWKRKNLEILCPNCHSLTKFYRGRNIGRYDGTGRHA